MGKKKITPVICDTNILFQYLEGKTAIHKALSEIGDSRVAFTIITHAEAYAGARKTEVQTLKSLFSSYKVYHLSEEASLVFNGLIQTYHSRHSKWIPDAMIAAIAIVNNVELFTLNRKDFDFIPELRLYNPK